MNRFCFLLLTAFAVLLFDGLAANAQSGQYSCILSNGRKCYVYFDSTGVPIDTVCDQGTTGIGTFRGQGINPNGVVAATLIPTDITASIVDPTRGTITTKLDLTRTAEPTTIRSVDSINRYPLEVTISFYANTSVESAPGKVFKSTTPLVFTSSTVRSLNPFSGEVLVLKDNVEFADAADPTKHPAFALLGGSTTVTLGINEPRPQYSCILFNGLKCYVYFGPTGNPIDTVCDQGSTGIGTFVSLTGRFSTDTTAVNAELVATDITVAIPDPTRGTITTKLDRSRTPDVTTIRSLDGQHRFPLEVNISFYATATIDAKPGVTYVSRTQLLFSSRGVKSLNPFKAEVATLQNDVEFYDAADPNKLPAFKLQGGRTTVILGTPNPSGPEYNCILINGRKCYVHYDANGTPIDTVCDEGTKGIGTFSSLKGPLTTGDSALVDAVLAPIAVTASVPDPRLGTITTSLDPARPSSPATIRSISNFRRYPLAVNISFYATAAIESRPGTVYKSRTQLLFTSNTVKSLNPFKNETLALKESVEFYDAADPDQRTAFTLQAGTSTVTLSGGVLGVGKNGDIQLKLDLK